MPALDSYILRRQTLDEYAAPIWSKMAEAYWHNNTQGQTLSGHTHAIGPDGYVEPTHGQMLPNPYLVEHYPTPASYTSRLNRDLQFAHNYFVSKEMCVLVTAAADRLPDDEAPKPEDFPTEGGFLLIPGGVVQTDIRGNSCVTSAILWRIAGAGVRVCYLADKYHPLDRLNTYGGLAAAGEERGMGKAWADSTWEQIPRLTPWFDGMFEFHRPLPMTVSNQFVIPPEYADAVNVVKNPTTGTVSISWPKGYGPEEIGPELLSPHIRPDPVLRWLLACLRLMQQPLTKVSDQGVPHALQKRNLKAKLKLRNTHVTVIEYRRAEPSMPDATGREFTHRFLRRGHWRWQPYKNDEGEWDRKRIWIHETIVGDESLPLVLREHVNALTR